MWFRGSAAPERFARTPADSVGGSAVLGFIGGSITNQITGNRWPEYVARWFVERYPEVEFTVENAAIGAAGSDLVVFHAERNDYGGYFY